MSGNRIRAVPKEKTFPSRNILVLPWRELKPSPPREAPKFWGKIGQKSAKNGQKWEIYIFQNQQIMLNPMVF